MIKDFQGTELKQGNTVAIVYHPQAYEFSVEPAIIDGITGAKNRLLTHLTDTDIKESVEMGVVAEAKHTDGPDGVCCFYLNGDDMTAHKRTIQFFLDNGLIAKTRTGRLYNISFKYDDQTRAGEYGDQFRGKITLDQFLNLNTGEWIV